MERILITGANGQLGSVLTKKIGIKNIIASGLRKNNDFKGTFEVLDVTDHDKLNSVVLKYQITQVYHLAAILSANGENKLLDTWDINMQAFFNVLEVSRKHNIKKVFYPSSIAVYGENAPKYKTSEEHVLTPSTVYGISKAAGENWANYYYRRYGLDIRSIRYPKSIDDSNARNHWGWKPKYDLESMTIDMIKNLKLKENLVIQTC